MCQNETAVKSWENSHYLVSRDRKMTNDLTTAFSEEIARCFTFDGVFKDSNDQVKLKDKSQSFDS